MTLSGFGSMDYVMRDRNGGGVPYFGENTPSKNLTAATAAIWANGSATNPVLTK
jgi:hypothetical protein